VRARLTRGEADLVEIETVHDLEDELNRLSDAAASTRPFIVELTLDNGDMLGIGLGRAESVVTFLPATGMPPYYHARGIASSNEPTLQFDLAGEPTEFPGTQGVPVEQARRALVAFLETGRRAEFLAWVED
jgi:hypothetical protein